MIGTVHNPFAKQAVITDAQAALQRWAEGMAGEYIDTIVTGVKSHERSAQKLIGPSEIGIPCNRALIHKLNQDEEPERGAPWKPAVGTALHAQMEEWFEKHGGGDWFIERKVNVGSIGPDDIYGSTDLFHKSGAVLDHKFVGPARLKEYKVKGPGLQYQAQAHLYGRGWKKLGYPVHVVMIMFVPRDGELKDSYFWWEPFSEEIALLALKRAQNRYDLLHSLGLLGALNMFPSCGDMWCDWCKEEVRALQRANPFQKIKR